MRFAMLCFVAMVLGAALLPLDCKAQVDHSPLDGLLQRHVREGRVDYAGMAAEVDVLDTYIESLAAPLPNDASREEKLALYINAYNACTLRMILRHYGDIASITEIEDRFGYHQWKHEEWRIAGETLSLDQMEHAKLRDELQEPRIHFAIVCASISCPPLRAGAYTALDIDAQLDEAARVFLASPEGLVLDKADSSITISRIFDWFAGDFTRGGTLLEFIAPYAPEDIRQWLEDNPEPDVGFLDYNWSLNDLTS